MFPAVLGYLYVVSVIFYIFKLAPNTGYDDNLISLANELVERNYTNQKFCLEGNYVICFFTSGLLKYNDNAVFELSKFFSVFTSDIVLEYKKLFVFFLAAFAFSILLVVLT